jgi:hypothetical protein
MEKLTRPFKGMVIELTPEQYDRAMAAISRASAAIGALRNQLVGEGESMNKESKRIKGLFYMGTPFLTDFLGGIRNTKEHPLITLFRERAVRMIQVARN